MSATKSKKETKFIFQRRDDNLWEQRNAMKQGNGKNNGITKSGQGHRSPQEVIAISHLNTQVYLPMPINERAILGEENLEHAFRPPHMLKTRYIQGCWSYTHKCLSFWVVMNRFPTPTRDYKASCNVFYRNTIH